MIDKRSYYLEDTTIDKITKPVIMRMNRAKGIHSGANTQSQDHLRMFKSFRVMNTIVKIPVNPMLLDVLFAIRFL